MSQDAREGLRTYLDHAGTSPLVTVPASWIRELLATTTDAPLVDRDCAAVAALLNRKASTIRAWASRGRFPGAYRLGGREWRFPEQSIRDFRHDDTPTTKAATLAPNLSGWRDELKKTAA